MGEINIPEGLKKVTCILTDQMYSDNMWDEYEKRFNDTIPDDLRKLRRGEERFTLGKTYSCKIGKSGKVLVVRYDNGKKGMASYRHFTPFVEPKKTVKEAIKNNLIKLIRKL